MNKDEISHEDMLRIARIVEDIVKIHALYEEIDRIEVPQEIKVELDRMIETMELLNLIRVTNLTGDVPRDYEAEYTRVKRGVAYVKMEEKWVRLGIITKYETIENLVKLRGELVLKLLAIFDSLSMDELDNAALDSKKREEIQKLFEKTQMDVRTLAILLRNISERLLFNEQEQGFELELVYKTLKSKIEKEYSQKPEEFNDEVDAELKKANENYIIYQTTKSNRMFEKMLEEGMLAKWDYVYQYMPFWFTDEHGILKKKLEEGLPLGNVHVEDSEGLLEEAFAALSNAFGTENNEVDDSNGGHTKEDVIKKVKENKLRMEGLLYTYFQKREEQKAEEQLKMIEKIGGAEVLEKLKGAVEDMVVMRRLWKQVERMKLGDETKMRYASIAQSLELLHIMKTGIINQEHKRDFWGIRGGIVYLKNPGTRFWNTNEQEIRLGGVAEERELVISGIGMQRTWAFREMKERLKKDVEKMNGEELAELLENIGRRLVFNQQDQHKGLVELVEIVWGGLKERLEEEKKLENGTDRFALKSDKIAGKIIATIRYMEEMKTTDEEAKRRGAKLKEEMYSIYLEAKKENIVRFRTENEEYIWEVESISEGIGVLMEDIKRGEYQCTEKQWEEVLKAVEGIDHDKVLLKGAKDKAFPLVEKMRRIIEMMESGKYKEYEQDLEFLFEASAVLVSKFVIRFQIPYVLIDDFHHPEKGPVVRPLNYVESMYMVQKLVDFLSVLNEWKKIRAPYYEYEIETKRAIKRITEETLCPEIKTIEQAHIAVESIICMTGGNKEVMEEVAEVVGYIADRVMVIDLEKEKNQERLNKTEQLYASIVLNTAYAYTLNREYKEYADKYGDMRFEIIKSLENKENDEEIDFALYFLECFSTQEILENEIRFREPRKYYLGELKKRLDEFEKGVVGRWSEKNLYKLRIIKANISLMLNALDTEEKGIGLRGKGTVNPAGLEEINGIGRIKRMV